MRVHPRLIWLSLVLLLVLGHAREGVAQCTTNCAGVVTTKSTGNQIVDGLWKTNLYAKTNLAGTMFGLPVVTYSFYDTDSGPYSDVTIGAGEVSAATRTVIRSILFRFSFYTAGIWFTEVTEPQAIGQIRIMTGNGSGMTGRRAKVVDWPGGNPLGEDSDLALNVAYDNTAEVTGFGYGPNSYAFTVLQHEIAHALGLAHPNEAELLAWPLPAGHLTTAYTIMRIPITNKDGYGLSNPVDPDQTNWYQAYSPDDDIALRWLYGCPLWGCSAVDPWR